MIQLIVAFGVVFYLYKRFDLPPTLFIAAVALAEFLVLWNSNFLSN